MKLKIFNRKKSKIIDDLIKRRDEVVKRARSEPPEWVMSAKFEDYLYWLIEPHIKKDYTPYVKLTDNVDRNLQKIGAALIYGEKEEDNQ